MKHHPYIMSRGVNKTWVVEDRNTGKHGVFLTQKKAFKCIVRLKNEWNAKNNLTSDEK